jgi:hypothetical protein
VQIIDLEELQLAWDVNVPGMGKRNRLVIFDIPENIPPSESIIRRSLADECQTMLHPPVSMVGIPAMKKIAREIDTWSEELGETTTASCIRQIREYLNSPPDIEGDHLTAGRDIYIKFLQQAGEMANINLDKPVAYLRETVNTIPSLAASLRQNQLDLASEHFYQIADLEENAYTELFNILNT